MPPLLVDRFRWFERMTATKGGASIPEAAKAFGLSLKSTAVWVSKWANYHNEFRDIVQHFLSVVPDTHPHLYKIGPDWWGERFNRGMGEDWHDNHDIEGINSLYVSLGLIKTHTDSITGKRVPSKSKSVRMEWINKMGGVTSAEFADKFALTKRSASTTLSNLKSNGELECINGRWCSPSSSPDGLEVVQTVTANLNADGRKSRLVVEWKAVKKYVPPSADNMDNADNADNTKDLSAEYDFLLTDDSS